MIGSLALKINSKKISGKYLLLGLVVCISMVTWLGLTDLRADELEVMFQNAAQAQHADNVARQAALQDPKVIELIELGRYKAARAVYLGKVETISKQITRLRAAGMGWGDIVHKINREYHFELHPSVLGLGHSAKSFEETVHHSKHSYKKSKSKMVQKESDLAYADGRRNGQRQGLALGHSKNKNSNRSGGDGGGHGGGNGGGNGGGKGGGKE